MTFLVLSAIYLMVLIALSGSVRTSCILGVGYMCVLAGSISYDAKSELWKFWLLLCAAFSIVAAFSVKKDREDKDLQDWMDSLQTRGPAQERIDDD